MSEDKKTCDAVQSPSSASANEGSSVVAELDRRLKEAASYLVPIPGFVKTISESVTIPVPQNAVGIDAAVGWLESRLAMLGIYKDEQSFDLLLSEHCKEGDARRVFCENGEPNIPVVRFGQVWSVLKKPLDAENEPRGAMLGGPMLSPSNTALIELIRMNRSAGEWSDAELVGAYGLDCQDNVVDELKKRSRGRPCVVFLGEDTCEVDVPETLRLLKAARRQETPESILVGGKLQTVYEVGVFPGEAYLQCPLHEDEILVEGYCQQCAAMWDRVPYEMMQFIRMAQESGEAPVRRKEIRELIKEAEQSFDLMQDYPVVAIAFKKAQKAGTLPSLRVVGGAEGGSGKQDPFRPGKRY